MSGPYFSLEGFYEAKLYVSTGSGQGASAAAVKAGVARENPG